MVISFLTGACREAFRQRDAGTLRAWLGVSP